MNETTQRVAHFTVTGAAMTEIARDLLLSDEPGQAYRLIADNLIGEGAMEAALGVMKGTHDLAGDSTDGLKLVAAEDNEALRGFKENYRYIYAGRHRTRGGWRRPVAKVVAYGPRDAKWATDRVPQGLEGSMAMAAWGKERARYHCCEDETVELLELPDKGKMYIIWEPCSEAPHWVRPPISLQEALDQALEAGRTLEERPSKFERELEEQEMLAEVQASRARARATQESEEAQDQREREWEAKIKEIGEKVRAQAGDDTFELELKNGRKLAVPRAPFIRWALCRTDQKDTAPDWENIAPVGVKMQLDNPDHTDWVLGSGLTLEEAYTDEVSDVAWGVAHEFQEQARHPKMEYPGILAAMKQLSDTIHKAAIIVDSGERTGTVGEDIAVFPDSHGARAKQLDGIIGAIVEKGGKLAHFAIVSKGLGVTVMRHPEACELFKPGTRVQLNSKTGRIIILEDD